MFAYLICKDVRTAFVVADSCRLRCSDLKYWSPASSAAVAIVCSEGASFDTEAPRFCA